MSLTLHPVPVAIHYFVRYNPGHKPGPTQHLSFKLEILPSKMILRNIRRNSNSIESKAITHVPRRHISILSSRKHLPTRRATRTTRRLRLGHGAGHEPRRAFAGVSPPAEWMAGDVLERAGGGAGWHVRRVRCSEAQGAVGVDVDFLAAGDNHVLDILNFFFLLDLGMCLGSPGRAGR